ncbi:MAG: hypothetical protein ABEJ35_07450 [Halobacteriaceae archaeon]
MSQDDTQTSGAERAPGRGQSAPANRLLLGPRTESHRAYASVLPDHGAELIAVTPDRCTDEWLGAWRSSAGISLPQATTIIDVAEQTRSAARPASGGELGAGGIQIRTVPGLSDLQHLGETVLDVMGEAQAADGRRPVLGLHDLSTVVQAAGLSATFRLLHLVTWEARDHGFTTQVYLDPSAVDATVIETLTPLFDEVRRFRAGEWTAADH